MNKYISWDYSDQKPWYLIPKSIITKPLELYLGELIEVDDGYYVYCRFLPKALTLLTDINSEIWYKRYIMKVTDDYVVRCNQCGEPLEFRGVSKGFSNSIGGGYRDHWFCSTVCSGLYYSKESANRAEYTLNSVESQARGRFTQWINKGDINDPCVFYLGILDGYLKYGVTTNINQRMHLFYTDFSTIHTIVHDTRLKVGELERDLKLYLNNYQEYIEFSLLHEVIEFIRNWKSSK